MSETAARSAVGDVAARLPPDSHVFKKIDSTLRGWIGAESSAVLAALPGRDAHFAPAYPSRGRTLGADGVYRVMGVPLAHTEFSPEINGLPPDSTLAGFIAQHFGSLAHRVRLITAQSDAELRAAVAAAPSSALWIGSPGLAIALAGEGAQPTPPSPVPACLAPAPIIVAAGSRRLVTQNQTTALEAAVTSTATSRLSLLRIAESPFDPLRSATLADELGARTAEAARATGARGLILTGGDIAAAVFRHLGVASAEIVGEVEDGLPVLRSGHLHFVTKAGGFGDDLSLVRAYYRLTQFLS